MIETSWQHPNVCLGKNHGLTFFYIIIVKMSNEVNKFWDSYCKAVIESGVPDKNAE
jgi:hypothetical protein